MYASVNKWVVSRCEKSKENKERQWNKWKISGKKWVTGTKSRMERDGERESDNEKNKGSDTLA